MIKGKLTVILVFEVGGRVKGEECLHGIRNQLGNFLIVREPNTVSQHLAHKDSLLGGGNRLRGVFPIRPLPLEVKVAEVEREPLGKSLDAGHVHSIEVAVEHIHDLGNLFKRE